MRKIIKKSIITLAFAGIIGSANAEQASQASVKKLMEVTKVNDLATQSLQQMLASIKPLMPAAPEEFWTDVEKEVNPEEMIAQLIPIYQKNLQQEDIDAAIKFYQTPAGQKFIGAQPLIMQESVAVTQAWGKKVGQTIILKYKKKYIKNTD